MIWAREFAMPNAETFSMPPVAALLDRWIKRASVIIDPFARNSTRGTITNDLNPATAAQFHMDAAEFVDRFPMACEAVLFDPPYSPRQVKEMYQQIGRTCTQTDTQQAYGKLKDRLAYLLLPGGVAVSCGWNSTGLGKNRGMELLEIMLVHHGGMHNDTIVTVERKIPENLLF
jgi:hypothetical protein